MLPDNPVMHASDLVGEPFSDLNDELSHEMGHDRVAESIRRAHIGAEARVKFLGTLLMIVALLSMILKFPAVSSSPAQSLLWLGRAAAFFISGLLLRQLDARGWLLYTAVVVINLGAFAVEMLASTASLGLVPRASSGIHPAPVGGLVFVSMLLALVLYILWNRKARVVMSEHYRDQIISRTPHVKYRSRIWLLVVLVLALAIIQLAFLMAMAGGR